MNRRPGYLALALALAFTVGAGAVGLIPDTVSGRVLVPGVTVSLVVSRTLAVGATVAAGYGLYALTLAVLGHWATDRRRIHDVRNVLQLLFGLAVLGAILGVITEQWLGVLFSLGVVGFAVTFALQQPLFSLIGWLYIVLKRPYSVGDRVAIEDSKGDVVEVDFLVTTLWEIGGDLVSTNQPSGRIVTLPNSVVLSSHVYNYSWEGFPYVWNELSVQVAYETDLAFACRLMTEVADEYLGEQMEQRIGEYRRNIAETPVDLEVRDRPTVNVVQRETWVELRLRYLVGPREGQRVRNELYRRILARMNDHPDTVRFPIGRSR